jgi:hypothetical protein
MWNVQIRLAVLSSWRHAWSQGPVVAPFSFQFQGSFVRGAIASAAPFCSPILEKKIAKTKKKKKNKKQKTCQTYNRSSIGMLGIDQLLRKSTSRSNNFSNGRLNLTKEVMILCRAKKLNTCPQARC